MQIVSRVGALLAAVAVVGLTAACDNTQNPVGRSPNPQPFVTSVEISGPASIPPGQSAQFSALARLSDGTSQTPTIVRWSSSSGVLEWTHLVLPPPGSKLVKTFCQPRSPPAPGWHAGPKRFP